MLSNVVPLLQRGFVEANADDGLLEIFGLKHGWHASFVMVELISAKHIAQVSNPVFSVIKVVAKSTLHNLVLSVFVEVLVQPCLRLMRKRKLSLFVSMFRLELCIKFMYEIKF